MKFLIFGGSGLVGKRLQKDLEAKNYDFFATTHENCNILDKDSVQSVFDYYNPDVVINATNLAGGVDFCEKERNDAFDFHFEANRFISILCEAFNARFVMISTDYVFDGEQPPYKEDDRTNPLNNYGRFKLLAEEFITNTNSRYSIVRTTNVFGWDPNTNTPNFLMGIYFKLTKSEQINAPSFLKGNPTHVSQLSASIIELCEKDANGTFHVVGSSFVDRYSWAYEFCTRLNLPHELLLDISEPPQNFVPRPLHSHLNCDKFCNSFKTPLLNLSEGLNCFLQEMKNDPKNSR